MPRSAKRDPFATLSKGFLDPRSFVSKDGRQFLYGEDTSVRRHEVWERSGGFCEVPGCRRVITEESMHMHHDKERSKGGDESMGNLVAACWPCHKRIHGKRNPQFRTSKDFAESLGDA